MQSQAQIKLRKKLSNIEGEIIAHHHRRECPECRDSVYSVTAPACSFVVELTREARAIIRRLNN